MIEVIVVCEGQTEERFVKDVLATHFGQQGVFLSPRVIHTSLRGRGGMSDGPGTVALGIQPIITAAYIVY